jgi:hypothetical protein
VVKSPNPDAIGKNDGHSGYLEEKHLFAYDKLEERTHIYKASDFK